MEIRFADRSARVGGVKVLGVIGNASVFGTVCPGAYAYFSGDDLGWASNSYVAPVGAGYSSVDVLGGKYLNAGTHYSPAASIYPCTAVNSSGTPNGFSNTKFGLPYFVAQGPFVSTASWTFDLAAAGSPAIATVGIITYSGGGWPETDGIRTLTVESSPDGIVWSEARTYSWVSGGETDAWAATWTDDATSIVPVPTMALARHRYWRIAHRTIQPDDFGRGDSCQFYGLMLWAGVETPLTLTYPEAWF